MPLRKFLAASAVSDAGGIPPPSRANVLAGPWTRCAACSSGDMHSARSRPSAAASATPFGVHAS